MEIILDSFMRTLIEVLNYQPLEMFGFGIRVFHLTMFWVITKMVRGQRIFSLKF